MEIGRKLRQIRQVRGKSQAVVAGLAGISTSYLSRLESGERSLDRRSLVIKLANALDIAPSELTDEMVATPGALPQDSHLPAVRQALMAVSLGTPDGEIVPADALRARVDAVLAYHQECRHKEIGMVLPSLIRDTHSTLNAHREEQEVLRLVVLLHLQGTGSWLWAAGGTADLVWLTSTLAQQAAQRLEEPVSLALSAFGAAHGLLAAGSLDLARETVAHVDAGTATQEAKIATGMLALTSSLLASASDDRPERLAALDYAADLASHLGPEPEPWFGFGSANVGTWRLSAMLESGEHADAAQLAASIDPTALPSPFRRASYWTNYGRALAKLPGQRDTAVRMLHRAEKISPARLYRSPLARETLAELMARAKHDSVGRELRGMAYRAGLPV